MGFLQILLSSMKGMFPDLLYWTIPPLIPFIIAEQIWPVHARPRWRDYGMNILIALTTSYLALPLGSWLGYGAPRSVRTCPGRRCRSRSITLPRYPSPAGPWKLWR